MNYTLYPLRNFIQGSNVARKGKLDGEPGMILCKAALCRLL